MVEIMGLKRLFTKRVNIVLVLLLAFIPISYFVQIIMQMLYTVIPKTVLADYDFVFSFAVPDVYKRQIL